MGKRVLWTEDEIRILQKYFPVEGSRVLLRLPGRTYQSVLMMTRRLGLSAPKQVVVSRGGKYWTPAEDAVLREHWSEGIEVICELLLHRSHSAILNRASVLGLRDVRSSAWSKAEDRILEKYWDLEGSNVSKRLIGRTPEACYNRAQVLGFGKKRVRWTAEEDALLRKYWAYGPTMLVSFLPGRSVAAIKQRGVTLGLLDVKGGPNSRSWTDSEDEILRLFYPLEGKSVCLRIPNRSPAACVQRAKQLGVRYTGRG